MYLLYQRQLALIHAQALVVGTASYYSWMLYMMYKFFKNEKKK